MFTVTKGVTWGGTNHAEFPRFYTFANLATTTLLFIFGPKCNMFRSIAKRSYGVTRKLFAADAAPAVDGDLIVNFCTPHQPIVLKKPVEMITLPGEGGVYAITKGHAATVSQLQPGVVSIAHIGVRAILNNVLKFY